MTYGITAHAAERPEHLAIVDGARRITYAAFDRLVNRVANVLAARGIGAGDRVAIMLPNSAEFFAVTHGAARLGALAVPINLRWKRDEIAYLLADSGAGLLVIDAAHTAEARPDATRTLVLGAAPPGFASFTDAVAAASEASPPAAQARTGFNVMIYTSGTTGRPKGVLHPMLEGPAGFEAQKRVVEMWGWRPDDVHLMVGPGYHTMPNSYVAQHLFVGATCVVMEKFDARECLRLIAAERVSILGMVPAHFIRILALPPAERATFALSSVRLITHAAAPCPIDVKRRIIEVFPPGVVWEFYGATEGQGTRIAPDEWLARPGSVGKPWPGVRIAILDDDGRAVATGAVGTIYIAPPGGRKFSYHNAPEKTDAAWRGEFFTVGDMGYVDDEGYLYICDRKADMVISGGVNIYPAEVENVLMTHPDVIDVAVFGIPDDAWGESLHAVVERRAGSTLDAEALRTWGGERMASYKVPRSVGFVDELPRDPNGKVLKRELRAPFWAGRARRV